KITGGSAINGAGISNAGTLTLIGDTVSGNTATGSGGGIYNSIGAPVAVSGYAGVGSVVINGADGAVLGGADSYSIQRSKVNSIVITFTSTVTFDAGAIAVRRYEGSTPTTFEGLVISTQTIIHAGVPTTQVTVRFTGSDIVGGSLPDGNYRLSVDYTKVHYTDGSATTPADFLDIFYRLFGDRNGARSVDLTDRAAMQAAIGSHPGQANYRWYFDYDAPNDGNLSNQIDSG